MIYKLIWLAFNIALALVSAVAILILIYAPGGIYEAWRDRKKPAP